MMAPSPGINGIRTGSHHTGTVPKVKSHNHNDIGHDVSQHRMPSGTAHSSGSVLVSCSNSSNHGVAPAALVRRDMGFSHMNNNLAPSMDWQPASSEITPQTSHQSSTRIRKESNTSASLAAYDMPDIGNSGGSSSSNSINGGRHLTASTGSIGGGGGGGVTSGSSAGSVIDIAGQGLFYDVPLHNSNTSGDNNDVNHVQWDHQEGSGSASSSGPGMNRRHQKSNNICEKAQIGSRLHQIRDYIGQTTSVMERLRASGAPHHMEQWLRLHDMLEGLRDSEIKLTAIQRTFDRLQALENNDNDEENSNVEEEQNEADCIPKSSDPTTRRNELKVKVEESQRKLIELREQQAVLLALKQKAQEQFKEVKAAEGAVLAAQQEQQRDEGTSTVDCNRLEERLQNLHHFYEVQNELSQKMGISGTDYSGGEVIHLQNKLEELQTKKMQIDQMLARYDASNTISSINQSTVSSNSNNGSVVGNNNSSIASEGGTCSNNNINSNSEGQTTEDKLAELSLLKEQVARLESALMSVSKSAPPHTLSNSSSNTSGALNKSQELEVNCEDDNGELMNLNSSSFALKQDNRTHEISQNHQNRQIVSQQQQAASSMLTMASLSSSLGGGDADRSITPIAVVQQQVQSKSLKLQEAKARLHHLQELLSLVEEFREAGKPVPEKILLLLNSPDGPLSNDDNLDLGSQPGQLQNRQIQSTSSSSSSSSLMSLFQPQNNNGCSSVAASNSTSTSVCRDKVLTVLPSTNRSDISSIQNLYQPCPPVTGQSHARHQNQQHHPPVIAKQKNNVTKLCSKTQELEEWMKKDDDPMSSINTDVHSLQQQAAGGYGVSGFQVYQGVPNTAGVWEQSPDYSSDDGGRSEEDNKNDQFSTSRKAAPTSTGGNASASGGGGGNNVGSVGSTQNAPVVVNASGGNAKDHSSAMGCSTANYINSSREVSVEGGAVNVGGTPITVGSVGVPAGPQNSCSSVINPTSCNVWRKHSTGSGCSLPAYSTNSRGGTAPTRSAWTPTCYCCNNNNSSNNNINVNNRPDAANGAWINGCPPDEGLASHSNLHHAVDNNTNWIVHQISQLQAQLQQMCQTITNKCSQGGLLMTSPQNLWMPPPIAAPSLYCQQPPPVTPPLQTPPIGVGGLNHYFGGQKQQYQQLLLSSLNQCCQLIWHQQCELSTLKEALHDLQQQQQQHQYDGSYNHHQMQPSSSSGHCVGDNISNETEDQHNLRSNLGRFSQSHPHHRNQIASDVPPSPSSLPQPPLMPTLPSSHFLCPPYSNKLNHRFQPFRHSSPGGSFISSPTGTLNNQVPPGNRANNYWDNFRSYSRQNLLSARSKCNEGRSSSIIPVPTAECSDRFNTTINSSSRRTSSETHPPVWGVNIAPASSASSAVAAAVTCGGTGSGGSGIASFQPQPVNTLNTVLLDEMMAHNLQNRKEKLNAYHSHPYTHPPAGSADNTRSVPVSSISLPSQHSPHSSVVVADHQLQQPRQKQQSVSVVSSYKLPTHNNSSLFKCDTSKGACKKSYRTKEQLQGTEIKSIVGMSDQINNSNSNTCAVGNNNISNNNNNSNNNSTSRLWNCHGNNHQGGGSVLVDLPNTINNRQPQQQLLQGICATDELPRNSNCKRRQLMSSVSASVIPSTGQNNINVSSKCNSLSGTSTIRTESNDLLLDSLEESMYSEVAALISVNEQRPSYLLQLFKDLKQINSDHGRQAALHTIHNLASGSPANLTNHASAPALSQDEEEQFANVNGVTLKVGSVANNSTNDSENNIHSEHQNTMNLNDCATSVGPSEDGQYHLSKRVQQQQQDVQQLRQPRNTPWRCKRESISSSVLPMNCRKLDWEVRSILVNMLPFLKSHFPETCTPPLLESIRGLVLQLVPSPQNVPGQLDALLEDALFKFQGSRLQDICDELISVVADVLISELTFLRLATSVGSSTPVSGENESDYCAVEDDEEEEDEVRTVEEEGAVGGISRGHDNCQLKSHLNNHHQHSVFEANGCSSKNDPVVSDAELAEADQSGRHSNSIASNNSVPVMTSSSTITESEQMIAKFTDDKALHSEAGVVDNIILPSSVSLPVTTDKNVSMVCDNTNSGASNGMVEINHYQTQHRKLSSPESTNSSPPPPLIQHSGSAVAGHLPSGTNVWAIEQNRENYLDHPQSGRNLNGSLSESECEQPYNTEATANSLPLSNSRNSNNNNNTDGNTIAAV